MTMIKLAILLLKVAALIVAGADAQDVEAVIGEPISVEVIAASDSRCDSDQPCFVAHYRGFDLVYADGVVGGCAI